MKWQIVPFSKYYLLNLSPFPTFKLVICLIKSTSTEFKFPSSNIFCILLPNTFTIEV